MTLHQPPLCVISDKGAGGDCFGLPEPETNGVPVSKENFFGPSGLSLV